MKILCTMPGKFGDIIWAMSVIRHISESLGVKVDFCCTPEHASIIPLVQLQPYIGTAWAEDGWHDVGEQIRPIRDFTSEYDQVIHLHYDGWPSVPLAQRIWNVAHAQARSVGPLDLARPWISAPTSGWSQEIVVGFSEEHFELKYGLSRLLERRLGQEFTYCCLFEGRWHNEGFAIVPRGWVQTAEVIRDADVVLACLSSMAVLAAGLGKPRVLVEPNEARWNPIFQHWDTDLVRGNDGRPTFDARAVADALRKYL